MRWRNRTWHLFIPASSALSRAIRSMPAAPAFNGDALPAVTDPDGPDTQGRIKEIGKKLRVIAELESRNILAGSGPEPKAVDNNKT